MSFSSNPLFILLFIVIFTGCSGEKSKVIEIFYGIKVERGYIFSEESNFEVDENTKYSLRSKASYGEDGIVSNLVVYKPEGRLEYNREEIIADMGIINFWLLPYSQGLVFTDDKLMDRSGREVDGVEYINATLLMKDEGNGVLFYRLQN